MGNSENVRIPKKRNTLDFQLSFEPSISILRLVVPSQKFCEIPLHFYFKGKQEGERDHLLSTSVSIRNHWIVFIYNVNIHDFIYLTNCLFFNFLFLTKNFYVNQKKNRYNRSEPFWNYILECGGTKYVNRCTYNVKLHAKCFFYLNSNLRFKKIHSSITNKTNHYLQRGWSRSRTLSVSHVGASSPLEQRGSMTQVRLIQKKNEFYFLNFIFNLLCCFIIFWLFPSIVCAFYYKLNGRWETVTMVHVKLKYFFFFWYFGDGCLYGLLFFLGYLNQRNKEALNEQREMVSKMSNFYC